MSTTGARRAARPSRGRRPGPTVLLASALVAVTLAAALLAGLPATDAPGSAGPDRVPLEHATVACPAGDGVEEVRVGNLTEAVAEVSLGADGEEVAVDARAVASSAAPEPVVLSASGAAAPGLVAARAGGPGLRAVTCPGPRAEQWFTGVAGDPEHGSVIELVNPDAGPAVVDLELLGEEGPIEAPDLRGIGIGGGERVSIDLTERLPRRDELAVRVDVSRGRVATSVLDRLSPIGSGAASSEWLAAQEQPATLNTLLGVAGGPGSQDLVLAIPGPDEARVAVQIVSPESTFAPADAEELVVPPRSTLATSLRALVRREAGNGAVGLVLDSSAPVTATLTAMAGGDRSTTVPSPAFDEASLLLPAGASRVLLTPDERLANAEIVTWDASGQQVATDRVELTPGAAATYEVPETAALLTVRAEQASIKGAVVTTSGEGTAIQPLRPDQRETLVPQVRPGLP